MENGRIVDEGTHESLRDKVGIYQKLWNIQAGGFTESV
ncbi:ABC transporter ATP-binding protein [Candidatus Uhrbacteria bacterium]|nr:MAG: ABC transporter ATP-binding protein [Candidatus Uhrbacteria bacterium]